MMGSGGGVAKCTNGLCARCVLNQAVRLRGFAGYHSVVLIPAFYAVKLARNIGSVSLKYSVLRILFFVRVCF